MLKTYPLFSPWDRRRLAGISQPFMKRAAETAVIPGRFQK
jgi:hypothetical protein